MSFVPDDEIRSDIIQLTAEFRFRICWSGTRNLLKQRGIDPMKCLLLSCDQGDDVKGLLMLPDGQLVDFDVRENRANRLDEQFTNWQPVNYVDREYEIARKILASPRIAEFDAEIAAYYDREWRDRDTPLPPVDRIWP